MLQIANKITFSGFNSTPKIEFNLDEWAIINNSGWIGYRAIFIGHKCASSTSHEYTSLTEFLRSQKCKTCKKDIPDTVKFLLDLVYSDEISNAKKLYAV